MLVSRQPGGCGTELQQTSLRRPDLTPPCSLYLLGVARGKRKDKVCATHHDVTHQCVVSHRGDVVGLSPVLQQQGHYVRVSLLGGLVEGGVVDLEEGDDHTQRYYVDICRGAAETSASSAEAHSKQCLYTRTM